MSVFYYIFIPFVVSLLVETWIFPKILRIALLKNIVDNPDARKLQRRPIPVLGGVAVMFGILVSLSISGLFFDCSSLFTIVLAMLIMLYLGTIDDIVELSPRMRFMIEILVALMIMYTCGYSLNDLHHLWGVTSLPNYVSIPLSVVTIVGITNAINLIDGVDGYSSGYCIMTCCIFGLFFYLSGDMPMVMLAVVCVASLIPFFFHNVFGRTTKMFIGDGGTLVMGVVMSTFVLNVLKSDTMCLHYSDWGIGLVPFTLSVLSIPVFDTVRVMSMRMLRGTSPFNPDKTHLHHLFIEMGFSHIGTTISILTLNCLVILGWYVSYKLGCSIDCQLYIVIALAMLVTVVLYYGMHYCARHNWAVYRLMKWLGEASHIERKGVFLWLQRMMDGHEKV